MKAIVIGPSPLHRKSLVNLLTGLGYGEAVDVASTEEARDFIRSERPELIALEWNMSAHVLELVAWIRSDNELKNTAILAVAEIAYTKTVVDAFAAGVNEFLIRPYHMEVVREKLESIAAVVRR